MINFDIRIDITVNLAIDMSLRFFEIKWEKVDEYLKNIGFMTGETSHKWAKVFIKGDYEEFSNDLRGGKQTNSFYKIEADAKGCV